MGRIIKLLTGKGLELTVPTANIDSMEQRAKECAGVLIGAYLQGKDPVSGHELSEELRDAIGPFAVRAIVDQAEARIQEHNEAMERLRKQ